MSGVIQKYVDLLNEAYEKFAKIDVYRAPPPQKLEIVKLDIIEESDSDSETEKENLEK